MTETGWQAIGRIAKERRERLGLKQDELAQYGGPKVSTVGKFERAAQDSFPLRTQHQMENALGWGRTIVEQVVSSIDKGELTAADWEHDLIEEDIPDLSGTSARQVPIAESDELLAAFVTVWRLTELGRREEALRAALLAIFPFLSGDGAVQLGQGLRLAFPLRGGDGDADDTGRPPATKTPETGPADQPVKRKLKPWEVDLVARDPGEAGFDDMQPEDGPLPGT